MMRWDRRRFLTLTGAAASSAILSPLQALPSRFDTKKIKAIAFDAFPIFDSRSVRRKATELYGDRGAALFTAWKTRQFEYTWLRMLCRSYSDFWRVTEDALTVSARELGLPLSLEKQDGLMHAYLDLPLWEDAAAALQSFRAAGRRLVFLSNFTPEMLAANIRRAGIAGSFEHVLSMERRRTFKPDARAYQLAVDTLDCKKEEILFVAGAAWDAAGAKSFGFPTVWVNRSGAPAEELGFTPDRTLTTHAGLQALLD